MDVYVYICMHDLCSSELAQVGHLYLVWTLKFFTHPKNLYKQKLFNSIKGSQSSMSKRLAKPAKEKELGATVTWLLIEVLRYAAVWLLTAC